jgi:1-phosphofructokinase
MLAGYLSSPRGGGEALATALQWGAAAVQNEGTLFSPNMSKVEVTLSAAIDLEKRLA